MYVEYDFNSCLRRFDVVDGKLLLQPLLSLHGALAAGDRHLRLWQLLHVLLGLKHNKSKPYTYA